VTSTITAWTPDSEPAVLVDVSDAASWHALAQSYDGGTGNVPLRRVLDIAKGHGVVQVLIERRYVDMDWRSEYNNFYGTTFARYPSVAHRLHFFTTEVPPDLDDLGSLQEYYRGYSVLRPLPSSPVGRTMIAPPVELAGAIMCEATEVIDLLGWPLSITAMPFISQDAQFLRCAHADVWMVSYHAHLRGRMSRHVAADIHRASLGGVVGGRQFPSEGLTVQQMLVGMTTLGFSPGAVALPVDAADSFSRDWKSLYGLICRSVNSDIPPIVVGNGHVWVMVGYDREPSPGHTRLTLYRHDDAMGPYIAVVDPFNEAVPEHRTWHQMLTPMPLKIYVSAERAEATGRRWIGLWLRNADPANPLRETFDSDQLSFVTYGIRSRDYKHALQERAGFDPTLASHYRRSLWPRHIWVVEAQDRRLRDQGLPATLGEVIIDSTASHLMPRREGDMGYLAVHAPGLYIGRDVDFGTERRHAPSPTPYESGRQARA
jgi:hypothetical protein